MNKNEFTKEQIVSAKQPISRSVCGVYFLIDQDEIVYVGQSLNAMSRIAVHLTDQTKVFDSYTIIECSPEELSDIEAHYILTWNPVFNSDIPANGLYKSLMQLKELTSTDMNTLRRFIKAKNIQPVSGYYRVSDFAEFQPEKYPSKAAIARQARVQRLQEIAKQKRSS